MCRFVGFLAGSAADFPDGKDRLSAMCRSIVNRGPDAEGTWLDESVGVGLGHRRLAVLDLSPAGAQPMVSASGRFVIAFNGEIYNHLDLRRQLDRDGSIPAWRGHSDTETLLAGFDGWGIDGTVSRAVGMFAFAVWDRKERMLSLVRDRLGEKPLYYGWQGSGSRAAFLFGSDLAALRAHPSFSAEVDRTAISAFMRYGCIGGELSIYEGIRKLPPGSLLTLKAGSHEPVIRSYWSVPAVLDGQPSGAMAFTDSVDAIEALDSILHQAIRQQMLADVPLGAFLSGGIDSSTIVAMMQRHSSRPGCSTSRLYSRSC